MKARAFLVALALLAQVISSQAVSITLVYQNPSDPFFTATAKSTMDKAAADLSYAITTTLNALSQDVYTGTNGSTTATANWSLTYTNPTDGTSTVTLPTFSFPVDEIVVFVGSRTISGSTLGVGGPGGAGVGLGGSGFSSQWPTAVDNMEAASNAGMVRGGPVVGTIAGSAVLGTSTTAYSLSYGYAVGSLSIDSSAVWNLDYNTMPTAGQNDLYSVAVHEMIHDIGFGLGQTWDSHVTGGNDWTGSAVIAYLGTGIDVLSVGGDHIAEGLMGTPFINGVYQTGVLQEAAMDPTITVGTRKYITDLDLAFLEDMGWETIPEPSTGLLALAAGAILLRRRRVQGDGFLPHSM